MVARERPARRSRTRPPLASAADRPHAAAPLGADGPPPARGVPSTHRVGGAVEHARAINCGQHIRVLPADPPAETGEAVGAVRRSQDTAQLHRLPSAGA